MKIRRNSNRITFVKSEWGMALVLAIWSLVTSSFGFAVPLAVTQINKICEVQAGNGYDIDDQNVPGLQPYEQATVCDLSVSGTSPPPLNVPLSAHAEGYASAVFGPGIPQAGITSAGAQTAEFGGLAKAEFLSHVQYSFEIQPMNGEPPMAPNLLPILFSAQGAGFAQSVAGAGARAQGSTQIYGPSLLYGDTLFEFNVQTDDYGGTLSGGFDGTKSASLYTNFTYTVIMTAQCWAYGLSASCTAVVDPSISFDQATFDAQMGADSFPLDQYYQFAFSSNLPVPEPETYALMLVGLGLVGFAARKRYRF